MLTVRARLPFGALKSVMGFVVVGSLHPLNDATLTDCYF